MNAPDLIFGDTMVPNHHVHAKPVVKTHTENVDDNVFFPPNYVQLPSGEHVCISAKFMGSVSVLPGMQKNIWIPIDRLIVVRYCFMTLNGFLTQIRLDMVDPKLAP